MDFLDNAVSKAKEVFEIARKKTEEAVNTGKQKIDVATIENKLSKDYEALGKIYYESIKAVDAQALTEEVIEIKASIEEKIEKIESIKEELNRAKNKRKCPNCGASIDVNSLYCSVCGAALQFEE